MDELAWVLEKKEQDKLTLLNYLTTRSDSFFPIKRILTSLGWSRYRTLSTITMLLDDLETYFPNEPTAYAYDEKQKAAAFRKYFEMRQLFLYHIFSILYFGKSQLSGSYWASFLPGHLNPMNNLQKRSTPVYRLHELLKVKLLRY